MCSYKWRLSHTTFKYFKSYGSDWQNVKSSMFYPLSWQAYTHGNLKVHAQVWSSQLLEVLHKDTETRGGQPTPGSFVLTSSLAADHKRFHSQECEHPTCAVISIHAPQQAASPWPLVGPRGTIHLRSLSP